MSIEEIREKLIEEAEATYFAGEFGGALIEASGIRNMSDDMGTGNRKKRSLSSIELYYELEGRGYPGCIWIWYTTGCIQVAAWCSNSIN